MGTFIPLLEPHDNLAKKEGLTITVSGSSGTGKSSFAKRVAELLGLEYISAGKIFRQMALEEGVSLEEFCRTRGSDIDLMIEKKILELAKKGGHVIDGRMSGLAAGTHSDARVLVVADEGLVAERVAERDNKSIKESLEDLKRRDAYDYGKYKEIYGVDSRDRKHYTLIISNNGTYEEFMGKAELFSDSCLQKPEK